MKSKILAIMVIFLATSLACFGTISCSQGVTEEENDSGNVTQPLTEDEYRIEIAAIAVELIAIVNGLDQMLANPEIDDPDWITTIDLAMEDITTLCDEACQITPPESMEDIHLVNLEAIAGLDSAMDMLADGIDKQDIDMVHQATTEMWLAAEILAEITGASE